MTYIVVFFFIVKLEGSFWSIMLPLSAGNYFMTLCFIFYTLPFRFSKFHLFYYPKIEVTSYGSATGSWNGDGCIMH